jgi:hypothetical protein
MWEDAIGAFSNTEEWLVVMNSIKPWMCAFADFLNKDDTETGACHA